MTTHALRSHCWVILGIILLAGLAYVPLARANYCGFDDTLELQRLTFQDPGTIQNDFQTVLFQSYKYRPLSFTLSRLTFQFGNESATWFRVRNILAHLGTCILLYGIGFLLFEQIPTAAAAALLFSLHPLTNQAIAGAVWVITPANFCLFLAFFLYLLSLRTQSIVWQIAAVCIGSLGVLIYDPVIVIYGLFPLYLGIWVWQNRRLPSPLILATLGLLYAGFLVIWFGLRGRFLPPGHAHAAPLEVIFTNLLIYVTGAFQVIDPVLSADLFGTPLPKEALDGGMSIEWLVLVTLPILIFFVVLLAGVERLRANLTIKDAQIFSFCILAWGGSLVPYLLYNGHASETYNYVGIAFLALIAGRLVYALVTPPEGKFNHRLFAIVVGCWAFLYFAAIIDRNLRVQSCGATLGQILNGLPLERLRDGKRSVVFANVPNEPQTRAYGMYGYKGAESLGMGEYGSPGIAGAVQFRVKNPNIDAAIWSPERFLRECNPDLQGQVCLWVHSSGAVEEMRAGFIPKPQGDIKGIFH